MASNNLAYSGKMHSSDGLQLSSDKVAFIYQDDSFFSQLSVRETLQLAASLRLYNNASQAVINEIITYLNLENCAGSLVGDIGSRGISGGERKRLAVACEMLGSAPSLLVADEPSSGLDSYQAKQVVMMRKKIAVEKKIAVVCAIHQPRSSIWNIFDDILLLAPGGHVIYHGARDKALEYFASIGHECPLNTNPAEFLIDLVSLTSDKDGSKDQIESLAKAFRNNCVHPVTSTTAVVVKAPIVKLAPVSLLTRLGRSTFRFLLLWQRALRQTLRDNATNISRIGVSSLLATLIGSMYGKGNGDGTLDAASVGDKVSLIAHASINVGMLSMVKALQLFKRERDVVDRERVLGRYTAGEYLAAKMFAELPIDAIVGAVSYPHIANNIYDGNVLMSLPGIHHKISGSHIFTICFQFFFTQAFGYIAHNRGNLQSNNHVFAGVLALVSCVTSSLGLAVGAAFPTGDVALAVGPALMVVYVILGAVGPAGAGTMNILYLPFNFSTPNLDPKPILMIPLILFPRQRAPLLLEATAEGLTHPMGLRGAVCGGAEGEDSHPEEAQGPQ